MKIERYSSKRGDKVVANEKALSDYRDRQAMSSNTAQAQPNSWWLDPVDEDVQQE